MEGANNNRGHTLLRPSQFYEILYFFSTGTASRETGLPSDKFFCIWTSPQQIFYQLLKKRTFSLRLVSFVFLIIGSLICFHFWNIYQYKCRHDKESTWKNRIETIYFLISTVKWNICIILVSSSQYHFILLLFPVCAESCSCSGALGLLGSHYLSFQSQHIIVGSLVFVPCHMWVLICGQRENLFQSLYIKAMGSGVYAAAANRLGDGKPWQIG